MAPLIREMEARDIPAATGLINQLTGRVINAEDMQNRFDWVRRSPIDWLYVCEVEGRVVGLLGFRLREQMETVSRYGEVYLIIVNAGARRQGIGRVLMDFAEQLARDKNCIGTWLVSGLKRKDEAHHFYEDLGYQVTGYRFVKLFEQ